MYTIQLMLFYKSKRQKIYDFSFHLKENGPQFIHLNGSKKLQITKPISPFSARPTRIPSFSTPTSGYGKEGSSSIRPTSWKTLRDQAVNRVSIRKACSGAKTHSIRSPATMGKNQRPLYFLFPSSTGSLSAYQLLVR